MLFAYDDAKQRANWSNFPTGFVPRGGLSLKEMSAAQRAAALDLMKTVLSPMGYEKVDQIRLADDDFKANGSKRGPRGGGPPPGEMEVRRRGEMEVRRRMVRAGGHRLRAEICLARSCITSRFSANHP